MNALVDLGTENLFLDNASLKPVTKGAKMEQLQTYHMRLDIFNNIESPDRDILFMPSRNKQNQGNYQSTPLVAQNERPYH